MAGEDQREAKSEKASRREARTVVGAYHQEQLRMLLEHVRDGFTQLRGEERDWWAESERRRDR